MDAPHLLIMVRAARQARSMDIHKMLSELRAHKAALDDLIDAAERFAAGGGKRRGRPPGWMVHTKPRGRPPGSKNKPPQVKRPPEH